MLEDATLHAENHEEEAENEYNQPPARLRRHDEDRGLQLDILEFDRKSDPKISYDRTSAVAKGYRDLDLFIQHKDGKKIVDPERECMLCSCLKMEMFHLLRVIIANRGPDTELLVANPVELSGPGRPRGFHDVTLSLKKLGICVFSAEKGTYLNEIGNGRFIVFFWTRIASINY